MLSRKFDEALVYASVIHAAQTRKGTTVPYLSHLLAVASIALEHGATEDEAIGALLHDAAEDQGGVRRLDDIGARFGEVVRAIVLGCSDTLEEEKPAWRIRKEQYIGEISESSSSIRLVSAADKLHNVRAMLTDYRQIGDDLWSRFRVGADEQLWYYRALVSAFRETGDHGQLVDELDSVVRALEAAVRG